MYCQSPYYQKPFEAIKTSENRNQIHYAIKKQSVSYADSFLHTLYQIKLTEKIAEIVDSSFQLLNPFFCHFLNRAIYNYLNAIQVGAHQLKQGLHAFCTVGDLTAILNGTFVIKNPTDETINLHLTAARTFHALSHLLCTTVFLKHLNLIGVKKIDSSNTSRYIFSAIGFAFSIFSDTANYKSNPNFKTDLLRNVSGFVSSLTQTMNQGKLVRTIYQIATFIHATSYLSKAYDDSHYKEIIVIKPASPPPSLSRTPPTIHKEGLEFIEL